jgi:hypothetical protein
MLALIVVVFSVAAGVLGATALRAVLRVRGTRLVECPEACAPAAVQMDLRFAARTV